MSSIPIFPLPDIFRFIVNQIDEGVVIVDARQKDAPIVFINEGFTKITGYKATEVIGRSPNFLKGPDTDEKASDKIRECINNKKAGSLCILNYKKDGSIFWNHFSITPIIDKDGIVQYWLGIERDITSIIEMIRSETRDGSMTATIHAMNDIINNFLNSVSFFRQTLENNPDTDDSHLKEFDEVYNKFVIEFRKLNQLRTFKERKMGRNFLTLDLD
jgi:PAS domain S-box-containing protein